MEEKNPSIEETETEITESPEDVTLEDTEAEAAESELALKEPEMSNSEDAPAKKSKKPLIVGVILALLAGAGGGGYYWYSQDQKARADAQQKALDSLRLDIEDDQFTFEYGDGTIDTEDVAVVADGIDCSADVATIDKREVGSHPVVYTLTTTDAYGVEVTKEFKVVFTVKDTSAPVITLADSAKEKKVTLDYDASFTAAEMVKSVTDAVDGELTIAESEPVKQTAEEGKYVSVYKQGWYTVTSNVDTSKAGTYTVVVTAADLNGNSTREEIAVTVNEKPAEPAAETASSSSSGYSGYSNSTGYGYTDYSYSYTDTSGGYTDYSSGYSDNSGWTDTSGGGSTYVEPEPEPAAPTQSVCLDKFTAYDQGSEAAYQKMLNEGTDVGFSYGDTDFDGCYIWYLNDWSASGGED